MTELFAVRFVSSPALSLQFAYTIRTFLHDNQSIEYEVRRLSICDTQILKGGSTRGGEPRSNMRLRHLQQRIIEHSHVSHVSRFTEVLRGEVEVSHFNRRNRVN